MKTVITIASLLFCLTVSAQTKPIKLVKEFPCYTMLSNTAVASIQQVRTTDSLKKAGFYPMGVYATGHGTIKVTFFKKSK